MFCKYCGKEISSGSAFCKYCGGQLTKTFVGKSKEKQHEIPVQQDAQETNNQFSTNTTQGHKTDAYTSSTPQYSQASVERKSREGVGFAKFLIVALLCFVAYIVYTNLPNLQKMFSGMGTIQPKPVERIYIANTYEAFANAKVGDWYKDFDDGNKPKQVTQADIDWAKLKLRERHGNVPSQEITSLQKRQLQ